MKLRHIFYTSGNSLNGLQSNFHLFLQPATVIGWNKSRDLFRPMTAAVGENEWK